MEKVKERVESLEVVLSEFIRQAELDRRESRERMNRFEEQAKLDRKESRERMAQADKRAELDRQSFNKQIKHLTQEMASYQERGERHIRYMNKQWGNLANKMGTLAEDIAAPNVKTIAREHFGCDDFDSYGVRIERRNRNDRKVIQEFDVVLSCRQYLFINETKSTVRPGYIDGFIAKLAHIYDYFPEHEGKRVVPVFSSLALTDKEVSYLTENKILAMAMGEGTMEVPNLKRLLPALRGE